MLSRGTRDSILAMLVLVVPAVLWFTLDEAVLQLLAFGMLAVGVAGVLAVRSLLRRVDSAAPERAGRRAMLEAIGLGLGVSALAAFVLLVVMYAD